MTTAPKLLLNYTGKTIFVDGLGHVVPASRMALPMIDKSKQETVEVVTSSTASVGQTVEVKRKWFTLSNLPDPEEGKVYLVAKYIAEEAARQGRTDCVWPEKTSDGSYRLLRP